MVRALASHQCGPGLIPGPGVICGLSFVVGSRPCSEGFSPGSPVFLPPQKPTLPNSNSIGNSRATGLSVARLLCATLVKHSWFGFGLVWFYKLSSLSFPSSLDILLNLFTFCFSCLSGIYDDDPEIITLSYSDFREYNDMATRLLSACIHVYFIY